MVVKLDLIHHITEWKRQLSHQNLIGDMLILAFVVSRVLRVKTYQHELMNGEDKMPSKETQLVIDKIKSGELLTPEYQESCRQRKAAVMLERSKREKQDNDFYTKLWEANKAKRESEISDEQMDTWGT